MPSPGEGWNPLFLFFILKFTEKNSSPRRRGGGVAEALIFLRGSTI